MVDERKRQGMIAKLEAATGRTLDGWIGLLESDGPATDKERRRWLSEAHGLGPFRVRLVVTEARARKGAE